MFYEKIGGYPVDELKEADYKKKHQDSPRPSEDDSTPNNESFASGAIRDSQEGKPRYDLIPIDGCLDRVAAMYATGAEKYGEWNWQKGMPIRRTYASLLRHLFAYRMGDVSEDHLAAVIFNAFAIMWTEKMVADGKLPKSYLDWKPSEVGEKT